MQIDLCLIGSTASLDWQHGDVLRVDGTLSSLASAMERQGAGPADATLFWDASLGQPSIDAAWLARRTANVTHGGLVLGTKGAPLSNDFIAPTWMWTVDPPPDRVATSWRLSLRASLIDRDVIQQLGVIHTGFESLDAAGLELGHRYLTRGAFVQHDRALCGDQQSQATTLSVFDDLLFARLRYGRFWARWALGRGLLTGRYSHRQIPEALRAIATPSEKVRTFTRNVTPVPADRSARVSVILPTIERYPYLKQLLPQLGRQTVPVHEIIIVDQTPAADRDVNLVSEFPDLPLRVLAQDVSGQCTARNAALALATGTHALFIDDDDEVDDDLVERHLSTMATYQVDVCSGVAEETDAGPIPEYQRFLRFSDVFPTNNTMIRLSVLQKTGMFDLAYDRKICEDGDLGTRLYLAGERMLLDPSICVLHHHAPRGGLRTHGSRKITYASSRKNITHRNLPHASQIYMGFRYYSESQVHEMLVMRTLGTLVSKTGGLHRTLKAAYSLLVLPNTIHLVRKAKAEALELLRAYPQIDSLPERS